jgi:hypothetical protein
MITTQKDEKKHNFFYTIDETMRTFALCYVYVWYACS